MTDQITEHEQALLHQYENDIAVSFFIKVDRMKKIKDQKLYRGEHTSFGGWLYHRLPELTGRSTGISKSTWRQWEASLKAHQIAQAQGVECSNEFAARELRRAEEGLRTLVVQRTIAYHEMKHGEKPDQLTAAMIRPVVEEINQVLTKATQSGHVDVGDGSMTGFSADIDVSLQERILRRQQHLIDGAKAKDKKNGWSDPITWNEWETMQIANPIGRSDIEIKWRIVEE